MLPSEADLQEPGWEGSSEDIGRKFCGSRSDSDGGKGYLEGTVCCSDAMAWLSSAGAIRLDSSDRVHSLIFSWVFINHNSLSREDEAFGKRGTATIFLFFKRLAASARMPSSCTQHHAVSPAGSFPNECHLPPCPIVHDPFSLIFLPTQISLLPHPFVLPRNRSFLHSSKSLIILPIKPTAASLLMEATKHQAWESEVL